MTHSFHRGSLALDFVGTVGFRRCDAPIERLGDAGALADWLRAADLVDANAPVASADLERAIALRESLARIGFAIVADRTPAANDVDVVNVSARGVCAGAVTLTPDLGRHRETTSPATYALGAIAADAVRVFAMERGRLARCELDACGGLILSNARGEKRRWCSMERCGNRAKVAAFRRRAKRSDAPSRTPLDEA